MGQFTESMNPVINKDKEYQFLVFELRIETLIKTKSINSWSLS